MPNQQNESIRKVLAQDGSSHSHSGELGALADRILLGETKEWILKLILFHMSLPLTVLTRTCPLAVKGERVNKVNG